MLNRIWEELGMESPKLKRMRKEEKSILEEEEERESTRDMERGDGIYDTNERSKEDKGGTGKVQSIPGWWGTTRKRRKGEMVGRLGMDHE